MVTARSGAAASLAVLTVTGCTTQADPTSSLPPPDPTAAPAGTLAPEPWLAIDSVSLLAAATDGDWEVIGLVQNLAGVWALDVRIRVALVDGRGQVLAEVAVPALLPAIGPGSSSPFGASFLSVGAATSAEARIDSFRAGFLRRPELRVRQIEEFATEQGEVALLGMVTNPGPRPVGLTSLALLGRGASSEPAALARLRYGPGVIGSGESVPFLAIVSQTRGSTHWQAYYHATEVEPRPPDSLVLEEAPGLLLDPQGKPFALGSLRNVGAESVDLRLLLSLWDDDRLLALTALAPPVPIGPDTRMAFSAEEFPGLALRLAGSDPLLLRIETRVEAGAPAPAATPLEVEVRGFTTVGSRLFLRLVLSNPTAAPIAAAGVFAELRSSRGLLVTAGWIAAPGPLATGAEVELTLSLPLPAGTDLSELEYDLRALGTGSKAGQ